MPSPWKDKIAEAAKLFYPGLGIKRWLLVVCGGLLFLGSGFFILWSRGDFWAGRKEIILQYLEHFSPPFYFGPLLVFLGLTLFFWGLSRIGNAIANILLPYRGRYLVKKLYTRRYLEKGPKIVAIGGGTGISVLIRGLKEYTSNITAVVTVTDDGGSSGRLRDEMGILPPGDLRNCLLALADTEPLLEQLFQHRFQEGKSLGGHSFGNLFIAAMSEMMGFEKAIQEFSKVLAIRGTVLPVTLDQVTLEAEFADGTRARGETGIVEEGKTIERLYLSPANCKPLPQVLRAIQEADAIILGPGSLYTSILANLLVPGVKEAIEDSPALCFYVCNIMTQPGETKDMSASMHLEVFQKHGCAGIIDAVIVNTDTSLPPELEEKYRAEGSRVVEVDMENLSRWNLEIIKAPLLSRGQLAHHDGKKLATLILDKLVEREAGLEGLWAYTFLSLNGQFRKTRKEIGDYACNPFSLTHKKLQRFLLSAFRKG